MLNRVRTHRFPIPAVIFYVLFILTWVSGTAAIAHAAVGTEPSRAFYQDSYRFDVFYNDSRIGEHTFQIRETPQTLRVRSEAAFVMRVLLVPVYRYHHVAEEHWSHGCLQALDATTTDNGKAYEVALTNEHQRMILSRFAPEPAQEAIDHPCLGSYAYWKLDLLRRDLLLNAQTGKLGSATLVDRGEDIRDGVTARRYTLIADGVGSIDLWYRHSDGRWIGLETTRNGGRLSYRTVI